MPVPLFHRDFGGAGGGPPIVFLHGLLGSSRNWQAAGRDLAARLEAGGDPRRVLAPDARNHGQSPHAPEHGYAGMAADTLAWLDARGIARAVLAGHSMGGKTAMRLAADHPERVAGLVVVDIAPRGYSFSRHRGEFAAINALDLSAIPSRAEADRVLVERVPEWAMRQFLLTNLERAAEGGWRWAVNLPVLTAALDELAGDSLAAGDCYKGPALVIAGGESDYVREADAARFGEVLPGAPIRRIPGAGHNPHVEAREAFVTALLEWLRG